MAKKKKQTNLPSWLKSRYLILGIVAILAIGGILGYQAFAFSRYNPSNKEIEKCSATVLRYTNSNNYTTSPCVKTAIIALNRNCKQTDLPYTYRYTLSVKQRILGFQNYIRRTHDNQFHADGVVGKNTWYNLNFYWQYSGKHTLDCHN